MSESTRRFARGAGWLYGHRWLERLLDFAAILVLARLLAPKDFGLVAIAASFVTIIEGLAAFDVNKALIRTRDEDRALYDTAFTLSLLRGLLAALVMLAVAALTRDEAIAQVLLVLAAGPVLTALQNPRFVRFEKRLEYSKVAILTLGAKAVSLAVTLALAVLHRNHWALVVGILAGSLASLALSYTLAPYRPRFSLARLSELFAFSGWLSLTSVVTTLSMETDKLIVGRLLGVADAGRYFMTQRIGVLPTRELVSPLARILFPSFSRLADEPSRLERAVRESINVLGTLSLPAGVGFALVAHDFVPLALGESWREITPLLVVLAPYLGVRATLSNALPAVMALGRTRLLFGVSLVYALVHVPVFVAGTMHYGLPGTIWSLVVAGVFYTALNAWLLWRTLEIPPAGILAQLARPAAATAAMAGAVLATRELLPSAATSGSWPALLASVVVGALTYAGVLLALWHLQGRPAGMERRLLELRGR